MPRKKQKTEERTQKRSVVFTTEQLKEIEKLAITRNCFASDVIRGFVNKGLSVTGYEENIGFLSGIIRQEVKAEMSKQANRICAMQYKVGAIASANYFLAVKIIADVLSPSIQEDFKDINTRARKQGMEYMNQRVADIAEFLSDEEAVMAAVAKIKNEFLD